MSWNMWYTYQLEQHAGMYLATQILGFMLFFSLRVWKADMLMHFGQDQRPSSCIFNITAQMETELKVSHFTANLQQ